MFWNVSWTRPVKWALTGGQRVRTSTPSSHREIPRLRTLVRASRAWRRHCSSLSYGNFVNLSLFDGLMADYRRTHTGAWSRMPHTRSRPWPTSISADDDWWHGYA